MKDVLKADSRCLTDKTIEGCGLVCLKVVVLSITRLVTIVSSNCTGNHVQLTQLCLNSSVIGL